MLLVEDRQSLEESDHRIGLRAGALVREDRGLEIGSATVVKEEQPLTQAPERGRAESGSTKLKLAYWDVAPSSSGSDDPWCNTGTPSPSEGISTIAP
jgi:hypothetical protein